MLRPTPAQLAYGSATVICSTLAMLLLSGASSGPVVIMIPVAALMLGVLVALTAPALHHALRRTRTQAPADAAARGTARPAAAGPRVPAQHTVRAPAASASAATGAGAGRQLAEPSLRR